MINYDDFTKKTTLRLVKLYDRAILLHGSLVYVRRLVDGAVNTDIYGDIIQDQATMIREETRMIVEFSEAYGIEFYEAPTLQIINGEVAANPDARGTAIVLSDLDINQGDIIEIPLEGTYGASSTTTYEVMKVTIESKGTIYNKRIEFTYRPEQDLYE